MPDPLETIITRWGQDRFAHGSYSYVGSNALPGDYDLMAKPIGNLFFAGEATCGTHPATVHGAYLSGLRAASEVLESIVGPIEIPTPLVPSKGKTAISTATNMNMRTPVAAEKRKEPRAIEPMTFAVEESSPRIHANNVFPSETSLREAYDKAMWDAILSELGPHEPRPTKQVLNPFLYYQKDYWHLCKRQCDEARRSAR